MKPSEIIIRPDVPFVATFNRTVREIAAAFLVLACRDDGDEWRPVSASDLLEVVERYLDGPDRLSFVGFAVHFNVSPDFEGLISDGFARWVGDPEDGDRPIEFTEAGLAALQRWRKPEGEEHPEQS